MSVSLLESFAWEGLRCLACESPIYGYPVPSKDLKRAGEKMGVAGLLSITRPDGLVGCRQCGHAMTISRYSILSNLTPRQVKMIGAHPEFSKWVELRAPHIEQLIG